MSLLVDRLAVLLRAIWAAVPLGTNLGLCWLLWTLISGRFLRSRGAVCPALADGGLSAAAVRRSGAALAYGRWAIQSLGQPWPQVVQQEGRWRAHRSAGCCPGACDGVGFFRPRLSGGVGKHYGTKACNDADPFPTLRTGVRGIYLAAPLDAQARAGLDHGVGHMVSMTPQ